MTALLGVVGAGWLKVSPGWAGYCWLWLMGVATPCLNPAGLAGTEEGWGVPG